MRLLICYGTRPEYIKVKSLIDNYPNVKTLFTGQHTELIMDHNPTYQINIKPITDNRLNNIIISVLLNNITNILHDIDYVMIQGDTTTALAISIYSFNNNIKVIHLEAGLRTHDITNPYPEELNRQLISRIASIHLCPTELNKINLINENIKGDIYVTGNTGLDNISVTNITYTNKVLVTLHRRDNHDIIDKWFKVLSQIAKEYNNLEFILPIHPNPNIQKHRLLLEHIIVTEPLNHESIIKLMKECKFIITDSGGIQEEASFLNKRVIICRKSTERPEIIGYSGILCKEPESLPDIIQQVNNNYIINYECPYFYKKKAYLNIIDILNTY